MSIISTKDGSPKNPTIMKKEEVKDVLEKFKMLQIDVDSFKVSDKYPEPVFGLLEIKVTKFDDSDSKTTKKI